jgi:predicted nucleic acid-binding protein
MFDEFANLMRDRTEPILSKDVELAADFSISLPGREARDLIHLAVMHRLGVTQIISADRGFEGIDGIERLDPARLDQWRDSVSI